MENVAPRGECGPVPGRVQARRRKSGPPAHVRPAGAGPAHQAHQARRRRSGPPAQVQARRRRSGPPDRCLGLCFPSRETKSRTGLSRGCPPRGLLRVQGPAPVSQLPRAPAPLLAFLHSWGEGVFNLVLCSYETGWTVSVALSLLIMLLQKFFLDGVCT